MQQKSQACKFKPDALCDLEDLDLPDITSKLQLTLRGMQCIPPGPEKFSR